MDDTEINLKKINEQLKAINTKINFVQDALDEMKSELNLIKKSRIQGENYSQLTITAEENFSKFLDNRPLDCNILDYCTTYVEKGILKVLKTLLENGEEAAIILIDKHYKFSKSKSAKNLCPNHECLKNSTEMFKLLKNIISNSRELSSRYLKELTLSEEDLEMGNVNEEQIINILTPLSNATRLKILYNLSNGGKYYSQLEQLIGIKAGHLLFHIEKLKEADYVNQENKKYLITLNGRKALSVLTSLRKEFVLK
ncbi:MAG: winged helix-turn-helix domain-containing protein [Promethearchaeota archaeon]